MATYQTGTATDVTDLLDKLRAFLLTNGWTINGFTVITNGKRLSLLSPAGNYFELASDTSTVTGTNPSPYIKICACRGYSAGSAFNAQAGTSGEAWANRLTGPFTAYHFFCTNYYAHVAVEITSGVYSHFMIGTVNKYCTFTGGEYAHALNWYMNTNPGNYISNPENGYHAIPFDSQTFTANGKFNQFRADIDGGSDRWFVPVFAQAYTMRGNVANVGFSTTDPLQSRLWDCSLNYFNQVAPLLPAYMAVIRSSTNYSLLGAVRDLRFVNIKNLAPGATITLGSDQWIVFPWAQKSDTTNDSTSVVKSGYYGFAYKKN